MLIYATRSFHILLSKLFRTMLDQHLNNIGTQTQIIKQRQRNVNITPLIRIEHDVGD